MSVLFILFYRWLRDDESLESKSQSTSEVAMTNPNWEAREEMDND